MTEPREPRWYYDSERITDNWPEVTFCPFCGGKDIDAVAINVYTCPACRLVFTVPETNTRRLKDQQ